MVSEKNCLDNKKVLFIGPVFYDYHTKIIDELKRLGASVDYFENKFFGEDPATSKGELIAGIKRIVNPRYKIKYTDYLLGQIKDTVYDYLFCIGGFSITEELIAYLQSRNPRLVKVIYFWDSFSTWNYAHLVKLFDLVYTFDPYDAANRSGLQYLPLFYTAEYEQQRTTATQDIDLIYIGSVSIYTGNRLGILKDLALQARKENLKVFFWLLYSVKKKSLLKKSVDRIRMLIYKRYREYELQLEDCRNNFDFVKQEPLSRDKVAALMERAKCVLDIPIKGQAGLTIRTIEALAQGKKLLTTNAHIAQEDFYNEDYIRIMSETDLRPDVKFINSTPAGSVNISRLHVRNWLLTIFNCH